MDIGSGRPGPAGGLTNFHPRVFFFRGVLCNSMEGLLQSLKFSNPEMQKYVCTLVGRAAKSKGSKKNWRRDQTLYWQGEPIKRDSDEYQALLDEAFDALFDQNEGARQALLTSQNAVLTHGIGKTNPNETVLTQREFCSRLIRVRARLQAALKRR